MEYDEFRKMVYSDFIKESRFLKLSYRIKPEQIQKLKTPVTLEFIRKDFSASPLIREIYVDRDGILIFPK